MLYLDILDEVFLLR